MIFIDSNIPMYLVGAAHPNKDAARALLERAIVEAERLVTDAEVLQEILHRYVAIDHREAIGPAFDAILGLVDAVSADRGRRCPACPAAAVDSQPAGARRDSRGDHAAP